MEAMSREEGLLPELEPYLTRKGFNHPLCILAGSKLPFALINGQVRQKAQGVREAIERANFSRAIFLHERIYRWVTLERYARWYRGTIDPLLPALFREVWIDSDGIRRNEASIASLVPLVEQRRREIMERAADLAVYDSFADRLTVFRGVCGRFNKGRSWTLSKEKAIGFACRFCGGRSKVFARSVAKREVLFYSDERGEQEVVLLAPVPGKVAKP